MWVSCPLTILSYGLLTNKNRCEHMQQYLGLLQLKQFDLSRLIMIQCESSPPIVLSWNSWNWPFTKRSTKLDFPTADSPNSTSLNWQILFPALGPLGLVAPPRLAMTKSDALVSCVPNLLCRESTARTKRRKEENESSPVEWSSIHFKYIPFWGIRLLIKHTDTYMSG